MRAPRRLAGHAAPTWMRSKLPCTHPIASQPLQRVIPRAGAGALIFSGRVHLLDIVGLATIALLVSSWRRILGRSLLRQVSTLSQEVA